MRNSSNRKIRQKDLAALLGCSTSTISKSLSDSPEIGESIKEKVKETAKVYGYVPNFFAKNIQNETIKIISVSNSNMNHKDYTKLLKQLLNPSKFTLKNKFSYGNFENIEVAPEEISKDDVVEIVLVINKKQK